MDRLEALQIMLDIDSSSEAAGKIRSKLLLLLKMAEDEVREFCNYDGGEDLSRLDNIIIQMALIKYNRLGTEGLSAEGYSGASYSYENDYPEPIIAALRRNRRLRVQ